MTRSPSRRRPAGPAARPLARRGAGLAELMIAVTLVSICAVVAIPQYLTFHRKAKRAEVLPNLRAMASAQQAWFVDQGEWLALPPNPPQPPGRDPRRIDRELDGWSKLGWFPESGVRCSYDARLLDGGNRVRLQALCDLDLDREVAIIRLEVASADGAGVLEDVYPERF